MRHIISLERGFTICVNGSTVKSRMLNLKEDGAIAPAVWEGKYTPRGAASVVEVRIIVGLSRSDPEEAGWYVFCNGRMLLEANQASTTGWGTTDGAKIPAYHGQYAHFRGFVFFDCVDPDLLPWNTTKTDINEDSGLFRTVRTRMTIMMHPVIRFLDSLKKEKERTNKENSDPGPLEQTVHDAPAVSYTAIKGNAEFKAPSETLVPQKLKSDAKITYYRAKDEVEQAKKLLGVRRNEDVGQKTFDYFMRYESQLETEWNAEVEDDVD